VDKDGKVSPAAWKGLAPSDYVPPDGTYAAMKPLNGNFRGLGTVGISVYDLAGTRATLSSTL
jgi:hypothetical protein